MKYHEAIDMILDGGECYQRKDLGYRFRFDPEGDWLQSKYSGVNGSLSWQSYTEDIIITKGMTKETDWIVEKDGVVYERKPIYKQYESSTLIADEVNEEWLEKKMFCFQFRWYKHLQQGLDYAMPDCCMQSKCTLCFPQEQPKPDNIEQPREKVTVEWILEKINYLASCNYTRGKYEFERILISEAKEEQFNELKQKLEYLVSLQNR